MRGEGVRRRDGASCLTGSSPHARGGPPPTSRRDPCRRLIPACAGRAPTSTRPRPPGSAHPRMRGEGFEDRLESARWRGSSPHARGGPVPRERKHLRPWLIPACAGRARYRTRCGTRPSAHPRMRGEGCFRPHQISRSRGSSPHARGGPAEGVGPRRRLRLIPACAGRAWRSCCSRVCCWAHPRMRGEGSAGPSTRSRGSGSSPHARGGPGCAMSLGMPIGLIPACAGRASCRRLPCRRLSAHPRMRGEGTPASHRY